ncbi:MAG: YceI family protein [Alphaproteobacteria bacterium]|nr:YceI family protein [Alphaproteobacteria bacterium]
MFSRSLLAGLVVMLAASPVMAQTPPVPAGKDFSKAPAGVYTMDKSHASLLFKINHMGYSMYHGRFNNLDARLTFDPKAPENSKIEATIDTGSIDTNNEKLEGELKGEKFFNSAKFPVATFKSLHVSRSGDAGTMMGELTILGITKPVTLNVSFRGAGIHPFLKKETIGFSASGTISRSAWGISAMVPMVGDEVQIEIESEFNYAGTEAPPLAKPAAAAPAPAAPTSAAAPAPAPAHTPAAATPTTTIVVPTPPAATAPTGSAPATTEDSKKKH